MELKNNPALIQEQVTPRKYLYLLGMLEGILGIYWVYWREREDIYVISKRDKFLIPVLNSSV